MSRVSDFVPQGVIPAVLLPFHDDFSIDEPSFRAHLRDVAAVQGLSAITVNAHSTEVASCTQRLTWPVPLHRGHAMLIWAAIALRMKALLLGSLFKKSASSSSTTTSRPTTARGGTKNAAASKAKAPAASTRRRSTRTKGD